MSSTSPLAAISLVIEHVRTNARTNASLFHNNEAATRAALIEPLLRALGWDTTNVRLVEPERTVANKQSLDYLLKDFEGKIRSVIEAKKLGESLDKLGHVGALIGYAFSLKPQNFFITDGLNWHCYSPTHSQFQPIETLNLADANPVEAALQLIQWLDAAQSGHGIPTQQPVQAAVILPATVAPANKTATLVSKPLQKQKSLKAEEVNFIEVTQLNSLDLRAGQKPKRLRLPNGNVKPITVWKDILLEVCRLVLDTNSQFPIPFPDKAGKKRALISLTKQLVGASTKTIYNGQTVFIGTNYSREDCIANALYALQQLPPNQKATTLAVSF
jgi:hypothetical protein